MILFLVLMFIYLGLQGAFTDNKTEEEQEAKTEKEKKAEIEEQQKSNDNFFHFGPDKSGNTKFFNMTLDNW